MWNWDEHHAERRIQEAILATVEQIRAAQVVLDDKISQLKTHVETLVAKVSTLDPNVQTELNDELAALQGSTASLTAVDDETQAQPAPAPSPAPEPAPAPTPAPSEPPAPTPAPADGGTPPPAV